MQARDPTLPEWAVARKRQQDGQIAQYSVADHYGFVAAVDAHVYVEAKCDQLSGGVLEKVDEAHVSVIGCDFLFAPGGKWVCARPVELDILGGRYAG